MAIFGKFRNMPISENDHFWKIQKYFIFRNIPFSEICHFWKIQKYANFGKWPFLGNSFSILKVVKKIWVWRKRIFRKNRTVRKKINEIFRSKNYRKITKIIFLRYERYFGSVVVLEGLNIILGAVIGTKLVHLATKILSK